MSPLKVVLLGVVLVFAETALKANDKDVPQIVGIGEADKGNPDKPATGPLDMVPLRIKIKAADKALKIILKLDGITPKIIPQKPKKDVLDLLLPLPPGTHKLQISQDGKLSNEIEVTVNQPKAPEIIRVREPDRPIRPFLVGKDETKSIEITTESFYVGLKGVRNKDTVVFYRGTTKVDRDTVKASADFKLFFRAEKNEYELRVKLVRKALDGKEYESALSEPVTVILKPSDKGLQSQKAETPRATAGPAEALKHPFAFNEQPIVTEVLAAKEGEFLSKEGNMKEKARPGSLEEHARLNKYCIYSFRFNGPAHFPHPRFADTGESIASEGVIIYEGMEFLATSDGRYEVRFNATTPSVPATLRLQLTVLDKAGHPFTLTLPAIALNPDYLRDQGYSLSGETRRGNNNQQNWQIRHFGYSHLIPGTFGDISGVVREGTARFGVLP